MSDRELRLKIMIDGSEKASGPIAAVRKESREAAKAFGETRSELARLQRAQANIKKFRDLKSGLQSTRTELEGAKKRVAELAGQIARAGTPTRQLTRDFERAKREAADLGRTLDRQQVELHQTGDRMREAGISTGRLAADERKLALRVNETNRELGRRKARMAEIRAAEPRRLDEARRAARIEGDLETARMRRADRWNDRARYGGGLVGMAVGAAATATGVDAAIEAAQYEKTLTSIGQKADLTREQAQRLGDALRRIAPEVARMPQDMAAGADTLAGIGLLGDFDGIKDPEARFRAIERASKSIMLASGKAATAYEAEQDDMVRAAAAGVQNLKISTDQVQKIFDIMAAGDNAGAFSMAAMASELPALTGVWSSLGQTGTKALGQLVAGLEIVKTNTDDPAEAANNLRNLLMKLNSKELANNFKSFGINLPAELKKAKAEGRDLLEVITELTNRATKGDNDKIASIFTDQQAQLALIALNGHLKDYIGLRDQVSKSDGLVDKQFDERMKDQASKWDKLKSQWSNFEIEVGKSMKPVTDSLLDGATSTLDRITANIRARGLMSTLGSLVSPSAMPMLPKEVIEKIEARKPKKAPPHQGPLALDAARGTATMPKALPSPAPYHVLDPTPKVATAGLRLIGIARATELAGQNSTARGLQFIALNDQRNAAAKSLADAGRFKADMRSQLGSRTDYTSIGSMMMEGLRGGLTAGLPGVISSILSVAGQIRSKFRQEMQIRSPSRVFDRYGRYISEGLAMGIEGSARRPLAAARKLARDVSDGGAPAPTQLPSPPRLAGPKAAGNKPPPGDASPAAGGVHIGKIEIHQQPGEDADALARKVIEQIRREWEAEKRRSYRDE